MNMKFAVWNMEWMNDLFVSGDDTPRFKDSGKRTRGGATVGKRVDDLIGVLKRIRADVVVVVEAPNRQGELDLFFDHPNLTGEWKTHLQRTKGGSQAIGIACRTDQGKFEHEPIIDLRGAANDKIFQSFTVDVDDDGVKETYQFARQPLYAEVCPCRAEPFRVLGVHLKSKGIFTALDWGAWWRKAGGNRRRILAEAGQLRRKLIEPYLRDAETRSIPLLVCGDVNDGPGMDASEWKLAASGIERLMGSVWKPHLVLHNALFDTLKTADQEEERFRDIATTRFKDPIFDRVNHRVWIDHLLYSCVDDGNRWVSNASVQDEFEIGGEKKKIWRAYPAASDHQPIVATLSLRDRDHSG